jgi:hypothetical protein
MQVCCSLSCSLIYTLIYTLNNIPPASISRDLYPGLKNTRGGVFILELVLLETLKHNTVGWSNLENGMW